MCGSLSTLAIAIPEKTNNGVAFCLYAPPALTLLDDAKEVDTALVPSMFQLEKKNRWVRILESSGANGVSGIVICKIIRGPMILLVSTPTGFGRFCNTDATAL